MLRSMTGYGKAEGAVGSRKYTVEVRSLNGKNLDLSVRMPSVLKEKEMELRKQLGARIVRGKSDVAIHFEADAAEARHELNGPVIEKYVDALRTLAEKTDQPTGNLLSTAVRFPDAMQTSREAFDHEAWKGIHALVVEAADQFDAFRDTEGATLHADFSARLDTIDALEASLDPLLDARLKRVRSASAPIGRDGGPRGPRRGPVRAGGAVLHRKDGRERGAHPVARPHCLLPRHHEHRVGPRQEARVCLPRDGREINTLGSKANDAELQRIVVQMKDELEKIKEQVLNVL